jgi:4-amino-4-deoxy-L-arabinose transferase-like glycosyltransferase
MDVMIRGRFFWMGIAGLGLVYLTGLFARLMENDSAQFAVMALRMVQEQDFLNLWKGPEEYLDKPHLHYWLAAFSYTLFGVHDWAYRIPAVLATFLGAYSCYGLGSALYSERTGRIAALIFMSAQTIVLSVIDVRTDAVLTGFSVFAMWQLYLYLRDGRLAPLLWGAAGAGLAFSTKGQIALLVIALPLACQLVYTRKWERLWNPRILWGLLVFGLVISPMLYAYYQQFDLHPEKVIRGRDHRSGIFFIFWEQSFERLSGEGVGKNSSDYTFFFHTFLWVFLPWTVMGILAYREKLLDSWRAVKSGSRKGEVLTLGGITLIFAIISFAQFKLPHYLNITIPLFAVLTAALLERWATEGRINALSRVSWVQFGIYLLLVIASLLLCLWVFPLGHPLGYVLLFLGIGLGFLLFFWRFSPLQRIVGISVWASILVNLVMNAHFYPSLLRYQGGSEMADLIERESLPVDQLYKISNQYTWALDFYFGKPVQEVSPEQLPGEAAWVYADEKERVQLQEAGYTWDREYAVDQFRISRLQARFLNPETRSQVLRKRYLLRVLPTR